MGRHHKPARHRARNTFVAVGLSGAFAAVELTGTAGVAQADPVHRAGPPGGWDAIIKCESNFNPRAQNNHSSASGLFQFIKGTWSALGGALYAPTAAQATPDQQTQIAERAYRRSGLSPWAASKHCWGGKVRVTRSAPRHAAPSGPRATPQPAPAAGRGGYTVRAGDSLSEIAEAHGVTWQQLWQANRAVIANPSLIHIGLNITLP